MDLFFAHGASSTTKNLPFTPAASYFVANIRSSSLKVMRALSDSKCLFLNVPDICYQIALYPRMCVVFILLPGNQLRPTVGEKRKKGSSRNTAQQGCLPHSLKKMRLLMAGILEQLIGG